MNYQILANNINDSLVFYRALFNRMPDHLNINQIQFDEPGLQLEIVESKKKGRQTRAFELEVLNTSKLAEIAKRMKRFQKMGALQNDCESMEDAIGLEDPDGYRWVIGNVSSNVSFNKCYINYKF